MKYLLFTVLFMFIADINPWSAPPGQNGHTDIVLSEQASRLTAYSNPDSLYIIARQLYDPGVRNCHPPEQLWVEWKKIKTFQDRIYKNANPNALIDFLYFLTSGLQPENV